MTISATSAAQIKPSGCCTKPKQTELTIRDGKVDTGRYELSFQENEVRLLDRHTNTWVKLWGDPHGETSDGDKFQFHDNVTFDLPDGTKVTIKTTPKDANGIAFLDSAAIFKGDKAIEVKGLHDGQQGAFVGEFTGDIGDLENRYQDGTILRVGGNGQIDDLYTRKGEVVAGDPTAKFGEHVLDGIGGKSLYDFSSPKDWADFMRRHVMFPMPFPYPRPGCVTLPERPRLPDFPPISMRPGLPGDGCGNGPIGGGGGIGGGGDGGIGKIPGRDWMKPGGIGGPNFGDQQLLDQLGNATSPEEIMFLVAMIMQRKLNGVAKELADLGKQYAAAKSQAGSGDDKALQDMEQKMQNLQFRLQQMQQAAQQFYTAASNISKSRHETQMTMANNLK